MITLYDVALAPIPYDIARADEARKAYAGLPDNLLDLIEGAAGCSPYLDLLLRRESDWLHSIAQIDLDGAFADILNISGNNFQALSDNLRTAKRRAALLCALADLGGLWSLQQVTNALTDLADRAVQTCLEYLVGEEIARDKLPGCVPADAPTAAGMVALAMGKMGAGELNYSSDIDLIMLFDETRHDPENYAVVRASFIRVTQRMVKLLSSVTGGGYVFRTDLRLRPDPSSTPVCIAMEPAERYYESLGRTWERAAFIKARPCAGDIDAGWAFLERLKPFIWRKYLDFAAIEDAHNMRLRIRKHKGLEGAVSIAGHNMKLGRGGIREIEFFTQTRQIISGGRDPEIRQRETLMALAALRDKNWIYSDIETYLNEAYVAHRTVEHRLQMLEDRQTHDMPETIEKRDRLAAFCGVKDRVIFENEIVERLEKVHDLTEAFFATDEQEPVDLTQFDRSGFVVRILDAWQQIPAMRSERARQIFARLQPEILSRLSRAANFEEALLQFDAFLSGLPAGVQLFSLFEANPVLLDLLVDICATAPELARYLGKNPQMFDAVVGQDFFARLPDLEGLQGELQKQLDQWDDYESKLNQTRRWVKEKQFRIGVHLLRQISNGEEAAEGYSNVAEACLRVLFPVVCTNFSARYGASPGKGAAVIAMGKLGSCEMTATSDLDLIIVYDAMGAEASVGGRSLAVPVYFARLTQALLSALSVPMSEGALYEVDMRLRPSGRQGPVATSIKAFEQYQMQEAWTWEHLALSRARVITGRADLVQDVDEAVRKALCQKRDHAKTIADVQDMRATLANNKAIAAANPWDMKNGAGHLMDIELFLQAGALLNKVVNVARPVDMLPALVKVGWVSPDEGGVLGEGLRLFTEIQQVTRLAVDGPLVLDKAGCGLVELLLKVGEQTEIAVFEHTLTNTALQMAKIVENTLAVRSK